MADLNVQHKKSSSWWVWLLLAIVAIALFMILSRSCNASKTVAATTTDSSMNQTTVSAASDDNMWNNVDFNSATANYDEITDKDIDVRGNDKYAIYSLGENVLFNVDKSTISADGAAKLKQVTASLNTRFKDDDIRIYGHADATGDAAHNRELSEQRATAVKDWMVQNASFGDDKISIHPLGESQPVATNATEEGRQQNRSVQIVVKQN